jgi:hypothetical protein
MTISGANQSVVLAVPLAAASGGTGATSFPSPGTAGNVLTSNGTAWTSAVPAGFPTGTVLIFGQTAAPTGWTKDTTNFNDSALRVVTGTVSSGGTQGFTTAFASQTPAGTVSVGVSAGTLAVSAGTLAVSAGTLSAAATTLATSQIPAHQHVFRLEAQGTNNTTGNFNRGNGSLLYSPLTDNAGGGGSHSHSMSGSPALSGSPSLSGSPTITSASFSGTAINLAVKYVDVIRATKD